MAAFRGRSRRAAAAPTPLEGLLQDVRELRLTLAADLNAAAGAAEADAPGVASDIVEADRRELARFMRIAQLQMDRLECGEPVEARPSPWRRRITYALPAVPLVGAMAVSAAAVTGTLPLPKHAGSTPRPTVAAVSTPTSSVTTSFQRLVTVVDSNPSASQVIAAATALHRQIAALMRSGSADSMANVAEVAQLLRMEQSLLLRAEPPGAAVVLDETRRLAATLATSVPAPTTPAPKPTDVTKPLPKPTPSATRSPSPSPSPTATKKSTSSSKPRSSPSSSQSPGTGHIPALP